MSDQQPSSSHLDRRDLFGLFGVLAALGIGSEVFQKAVAVQADKPAPITLDTVKEAEWIAGLTLSDADRKAVAGVLNSWRRDAGKLREVKVENSVPFPLVFNPVPGQPPGAKTGTVELNAREAPRKPDSEDELAFLPLTALAGLLRTRKISSTELTKLYLRRLKDYDPLLHCVVTLTEKTALEQAAQADKEIAAGRYRGPLHGIPWGAKDLIAYPGYPTTWGAEAYQDQELKVKATVARKLEEAGAVLLAKLSLGSLAYGDRWFGDRMTRNPWNPSAGSSGSSAGSASATAAGLIGFALGSETLGSIVSPSRVCGTTGLRPTFGRVSRAGCMTLCWSMDKIGPIARSIEDCAVVFGTLHGRDSLDASTVDRPFSWPPKRALKTLKVGYFAGGRTGEQTLKVLRGLGVTLVPIDLPSKYLLGALHLILHAEAAAAFDDLTRAGKQLPNNWRHSFQAGLFISANDYIRANRVRGLLMQEMEEVMEKVDLYVGGGGNELLLTNLTGHPEIVLPDGFAERGKRKVPTSITFTGRLFGEEELLAVGMAYQQARGFHLEHPSLEKPS
jgi:Asp-tRNA(Asn)/Glu-tRNA(Gln) amidotransferase A subunit family amidase